MRYTRIMTGALLSAAIAVSAAPARAQETPTPRQSTESFGDWSVECTSLQPAPAETIKGDKPSAAGKRVCEVVQTYRNTNTNTEIARLAFGYGTMAASDETKLLAGMRVLVDISFGQPPVVFIGEEAAFQGTMQRCLGSFCYATFEMGDGGTTPLEKASSASLRFPVASGQLISINISTNGLTDALKVLAERNK